MPNVKLQGLPVRRIPNDEPDRKMGSLGGEHTALGAGTLPPPPPDFFLLGSSGGEHTARWAGTLRPPLSLREGGCAGMAAG